MEMIDGNPLKIHLRGMRGTSKDEENLEILEAFVSGVANALKFMLLYMRLVGEIEKDPDLRDWYRLRAA
jgi:hypothetical protein